MTQLVSRQQHYMPGRSQAATLVAEYGSPLYVYDAQSIKNSACHVSTSVRYPHTKFAFASVTNGNIALLRLFLKAGWSLHANTPGDAYLGLSAGFAARDIIYSGSNLTSDEFAQMLQWGVRTYNLDSLSQLQLLCKTREEQFAESEQTEQPQLTLGFRLNLPQVTGETRIGIPPSELAEADALAKSYGLAVTGIHFYRGTSTNATQRFTDAMESVFQAGLNLPDWQYLDFGGGFGFPYHDRKQSFDWPDFGEQLTEMMAHYNSGRKSPLNLLIEPGRSVIAGCASMIATVVSTKILDGKQIVGVDTTTSNIAVLSVHGGSRQVRALKGDSETLLNSDVCGNTTFSKDYISRNCMLPPMEPGDLISILDVGAYGYAMSSHFLHRPKPPEVLLDGGSHRLIRKGESWDILLANQMDEELVVPPPLTRAERGASL